MTLPKGYGGGKSGGTPGGSKHGNAIVAIMVIIVMASVIAIAAWLFISARNSNQEYIDLGCTPLTADQFGNPSTWSCPPGTQAMLEGG